MDLHRLAGFDDFQQRVSGQVIPRRRHDADARMLLLDQRAALLDAFSGEQLRAAENDGRARLDLIQEEFAEVLHIHAALAGIDNRRTAGHNQISVTLLRMLDRNKDLAELADTGRLNQQAVRMVLLNQLIDCLLEVADQRAADAAGIQFVHNNAGILHKASINADFAVLVFQQDDLFLADAAGQQLLDERGLACTEKAGNNIHLYHSCYLLFIRLRGSWRQFPPTCIIAQSSRGNKRFTADLRSVVPLFRAPPAPASSCRCCRGIPRISGTGTP